MAISEALDNRPIIRPPDENCTISRLGQGTCEDQVSTAMRFPGEVRCASRKAARRAK
jgi:hypothetical protein